jgi:hypothetical protein
MSSEMVERVGRAMLDAHQQWEQENNRLGGDVVWTSTHLELLARIAIEAMEPFIRAREREAFGDGYDAGRAE